MLPRPMATSLQVPPRLCPPSIPLLLPLPTPVTRLLHQPVVVTQHPPLPLNRASHRRALNTLKPTREIHARRLRPQMKSHLRIFTAAIVHWGITARIVTRSFGAVTIIALAGLIRAWMDSHIDLACRSGWSMDFIDFERFSSLCRY